MKTFRYYIYGLTIESEIELPELPAVIGPPDVTIRLGKVARVRGKATNESEFAFNDIAGAFHIRCGREIVVDPLPGVDSGALRVVLLGRIMAFLLRQRGSLPLHASAILIDGRAALFVGASGSGKSTMAAALHAAGHVVIADDVAAVGTLSDVWVVRPALPQLRVFDDSRAFLAGLEARSTFQIDKHTIILPGTELRRYFPIWRIFVLQYGPERRIDLIPKLDAVSLLSLNSFVRHRKMAPHILESHLRDCVALAGSVPVHRLERRQDLEEMPSLIRMLEQEAGAVGDIQCGPTVD